MTGRARLVSATCMVLVLLALGAQARKGQLLTRVENNVVRLRGRHLLGDTEPATGVKDTHDDGSEWDEQVEDGENDIVSGDWSTEDGSDFESGDLSGDSGYDSGDCGCDEDVREPVCAIDGSTFPSRCHADCVGMQVIAEGPCDGYEEEKSDDGQTPGCDCAPQDAPVCAVNGKTYENKCQAGCDGVQVARDGKCTEEEGEAGCACTLDYRPVCGDDGQTYSNRCMAACAGVKVVADGECKKSSAPCAEGVEEVQCLVDPCSVSNITCPVGEIKAANYCGGCNCECVAEPEVECTDHEHFPVCGADGQTYDNPCYARAARTTVAYDGVCEAAGSGSGEGGVACIEIYKPVCGSDGMTHSNDCFAATAGASVVRNGTCSESAQCKEGVKGVECEQNPCMVVKCTANTRPVVDHCGEACTCTCKGPDVCPAIYLPVCGTDGKTYSNNCEAAQANMDIAYDGECKKSPLPPCPPELGEHQCLVDPCAATTCPTDTVPVADYCGGCNCRCTKPDTMCPEVYAPVCGTDRRTYPSSCRAEAMGVGVAYSGNCTYDPSIGCTKEYNPQCGRDGVTYDNPCLAAAAGAEIAHAGTCKGSGDACDTVFDPVCGKDGETYDNACLAEKAGVNVAHEGACRPKSVFDGECKGAERIDDPVCVLAPGSSAGTTYRNPCYAREDGVDLGEGYLYYRGECKRECDTKCNPASGTDIRQFVAGPTCCSPGAEYPNQCYAQCVGGLNAADLRKCYRGQCTTGRAVYMLTNVGNCPAGTTPFQCEVFGCVKQRYCEAAPAAKCVALRPCVKFFRLNFLAGACDGHWVNTRGSLVPQCHVAGDLVAPPPSNNTTCVGVGEECTMDPLPLDPNFTNQVPVKECCSRARCSAGERPLPGQLYGTCVEA